MRLYIINRIILLYIPITGLIACSSNEKANLVIDSAKEEQQINATLDSLNRAAAKADFNAYFKFYTDDAIFTGTDATERWDKTAFKAYAMPFFERGIAWNFTSIDRHIHLDETGNIAWFDELLNTQMKICRGSGVLVKKGPSWKVQQYILSTTVPNEKMDMVIQLKSHIEDSVISVLSRNAVH